MHATSDAAYNLMIRVLAVASEVYPLIKTGGLADVTGALPPALAACGVAVTTLLPGYPPVMDALTDATLVRRFADLFGGPARVMSSKHAGLDLLVLDAPHLFGRDGNPYLAPDGREWPDNGLRFAGLGAAAAALAVGSSSEPAYDILHAHDWQAALAVAYLKFHDGTRPATVLTIHNLAFQGRYKTSLFTRLGLPKAALSIEGMEFHGDINFLKAGLVYADYLTTVSPTYAREITSPVDGMGLDGVLRQRSTALSGILNGIDEQVWNPETDALIPAPFDRVRLSRRRINKTALQERFGLQADPHRLLLGVVSRMTTQKGLDLLIPRLDELAQAGVQVVILGAGDHALEHGFIQAAARWPDAIGCQIGYNEPLAHLVQAGSDALLVPSRFEPCGLTQMYALRYGTIPVVARVGGLADTVIDANEAALSAGVATGLQFAPVSSDRFWTAMQRLLALWPQRKVWERMQRNAMAADVSWRRPAQHYSALYQSLLTSRR